MIVQKIDVHDGWENIFATKYWRTLVRDLFKKVKKKIMNLLTFNIIFLLQFCSLHVFSFQITL